MSVANHQVLKRVCDALGLQGRAVRRIVLDMAIDDVAKLYVEEFPNRASVEALSEVLPDLAVDVTSVADVAVDARAGVHVKYLPIELIPPEAAG